MTAPWEDTRVAAGLRRQLTTRRRVLAEGAAGIGWKVGFGAPASLDLMDITAPLVGFLTDATVSPSGARIDTSGWIRGVVEFELAVYLGADLGPGASLDEAGAAISAVGPAIELANIDLPIEASGVEDIVAGNIFHEGVVFGAPDEGRAGLDITGLVARILVDGEQRATTTDLQAITGAYPLIVATVANTLAANGMTLRAGDLIITGSVVPPIPVTDGTEFTFVLEPFAPISVAAV
jgi:2-keto-4-pentenoate hydratase